MGKLTLWAGIVLTPAIPIALIVLGHKYYDDCALEPWVPKCVIISGALTLGVYTVAIILSVLKKLKIKNKIIRFQLIGFLFLLLLTTFVWHCIATRWIFGSYNDWKKTKNEPISRCNNGFFQFVYFIMILFWVFVGIVICALVFSKKSRKKACFSADCEDLECDFCTWNPGCECGDANCDTGSCGDCETGSCDFSVGSFDIGGGDDD